jgi:hypothetical protein
MIRLIIAFVCSVFDARTSDLAEGARRTAPTYLTDVTALEHALAASTAARVWNVDPALLLSIAWHESRYEVTEVTPEVGGRVSCGVMTPEPVARCSREGLVDSYLRGARHLAQWLSAMHGNLRAALGGYAGGYRLLAFCADGGEARGCHVADVFLGRAAMIRARHRAS